MRQKCVRCVVTSAPPSQFVMWVRSTIVANVLTPTLVRIILFVNYILGDILCYSILIFRHMQRALQGSFVVHCSLLGEIHQVRTNLGLRAQILDQR